MGLRISARQVRTASACAFFLAIVLAVWGCGSVTSTDRPQSQTVTVQVNPPSISVVVASTQKFSAAVSPTTTAVTWQVNGVSGGDSVHGKIDSSGMYTAPSAVPSPATVSVSAVSQTQPSALDSAEVTIMEAPKPISVSVLPATASVQSGQTHSFSATVDNDSQNKGVSWALSGAGCSGASCGSLSANSSASGVAVVYTAPPSVPAPATVTLTATSVAETTKASSATITVTAIPPPIAVSMNPTSASVQTGQGHSFTATVQNDSQNKGVTWTLTGSGCSGTTCGTLSAASSASGVAITYTAPASVPSPATVTLKAESVADTTKSASATITITAPAPISVSVNPASVSVQATKSTALTATVQNDPQDKGVNWTVSGTGCSGATCGTLSATTSASGVAISYIAPAFVPTPATVTVTAKSIADTSKTDTATITITPPPPVAVSVNPQAASVETGKTQSISATVQNDSQNLGVTWTLVGAGCTAATCGTLSAASSASGTAIIYTAPAVVPTPATVTLTATSVADNSKTASATFTIVPPPPVSVSVLPATATVQTNNTQSITATVQNDPQNKGVSWTLTGAGCTAATCGTLSAATSASGAAVTYTAPAAVPSPTTVTLTATSVADGTKTASATFTIVPPPPVSVTVLPTTATVQTNNTQSITATVQNDPQNKGVTWTLTGAGCSGATCGTLSAAASASGAAITYTAPAAVPSPATVTLTATSVADTTKVASATFTIVPPPPVSVSVLPTTATVQTNNTQSITATVQNDLQNKGVSWTLTGAGCTGATCGTLSAVSSASGAAITYTAPGAVPSPATVTLTATSVADTTKAASATFTIVPPPPIVVAVNPTSASVQTNLTQSVSATLQNDLQNKGVSWALSGAGCSGATCGTLSATTSLSGVAITYTAPAAVPSPATVTLTATSVADNTKTSAMAITVTPPPPITVTVNPTSASVQTTKTQSATATLTNDLQNKGVSWALSGAGCSGATCGTLSATTSLSGVAITYTAPANVPSPATVTLTATSVADNTKTSAINITVTAPPPITVAVSPTSASVQTTKTQSATATLTNDSQNQGVSWALSGAGCLGATCGTLSATTSLSGVAITYTAPASVPSPAAVTLTATSVADNTKSSAMTITVTAPPPITVAVNPTSASVQTTKTQSATATLTNDTQNKGVSWALSGAGCSGATCGTLSATTSLSGVAITYTAPASVPSPAIVTLTATSVADNTKSSAMSITVTAPPPITVAVNPTSASVQTAHTQSVTATLTNDTQNKGVSWALSGAGCSGATCGTLSATTSLSGVAITYTAPAIAPTPATVLLAATSVADTTKSASSTITITFLPPVVSITPKRAALTTAQPQTFGATVTGGNGVTAVTWEVDTIGGGNSSIGTINASGVYTPPASPGTHTIGARSVADTTVVATATIYVTDLSGVFTYHNDLSRDGVNSKEYALSSATVKTATFGKRFACSIDATAYAQPLWVANVNIGGGLHNVIVAATQHDTVYVFDADASPCHTYWSKSLLGSGETWVSANDVGTTDITPDIGIVGTPVIDPATSTIYVVAKSKNGSTFHQRLHALSLIDGSEKFTGPRDIAFSSGGATFDALRENQRAGLALYNGVVYIAYASHGDQPTYYGWVVGYSASNLGLFSVYNDEPGAGYGGIWMAGGAPAVDSSGSMYVITGNGTFNSASLQFGDSFLRLSTGASMSETSFFTPSNQQSLNGNDQDLGGGGATLLIDQASGPVQHLLVGGGKEGKLYLLNRDNLGGNTGTDSGALQIFSPSASGIFSTPAFWQNTLYICTNNDHVKAFAFNTSTGKFNIAASTQSPGTFSFPGSTPSVSAQGTSNGIIWAIQRVSGSPAVLHAYDASNLNTELWNSTGSGDQAGNSVKFVVPTVANGKVYVGTTTEISVYGLSPN